MISFLTAQKIHQRRLRRGPVYRKRLIDALGCVCGRDVLAREDSPSFDKAMMDGFAVSSKDLKGHRGVALPVSSSVFPGQKPSGLVPGTCQKIATGAWVSAAADAVVKKEDCRHAGDGRVVFFKKVSRGENVCRRGAHVRKGDRIFSRGDRVTAAGVALAASQGIKELWVYAPPAVTVLSTGDEIAAGKKPKSRFGIWNATGPMLMSALKEAGASPVSIGVARDDETIMLRAIRQGLAADILIVTGAVSVGERDIVARLLKKAGVRIFFHKVLMKPGKPVLFGGCEGQLVYGLPGNPVSSLVTFLLFVRPAIDRWRGGPGELPWEQGVLTKKFSYHTDRLSFLPARLRFGKGRWQVDPLAYQDSADMRSSAQAGCFFVFEKDLKILAKGARVRFLRVN